MSGHPEFCFITPISLLEQYASQSTKHLCLAHLVDSSDEYANFYKRMRARGDYIICDNGAFELGESYAPEKLLALGHKCGANAIVLPDYPAKDSLKTIDAAKEWLPIIKQDGFDAFFCPQGIKGSLTDWLRGYDFAANNPDIDIIGMSILAIPNALPHIDYTYARVVMSQLLLSMQRFNTNKKHHYLGLNASPNIEIPSLINMQTIWSCDSSNPVWSGVNGHRYNPTSLDWLYIKKQFLPHVDFNIANPTLERTHEIIQHNIDLTKGLFV